MAAPIGSKVGCDRSRPHCRMDSGRPRAGANPTDTYFISLLVSVTFESRLPYGQEDVQVMLAIFVTNAWAPPPPGAVLRKAPGVVGKLTDCVEPVT